MILSTVVVDLYIMTEYIQLQREELGRWHSRLVRSAGSARAERGSPISRFECVFSISLQLYLMDINQHSKSFADIMTKINEKYAFVHNMHKKILFKIKNAL